MQQGQKKKHHSLKKAFNVVAVGFTCVDIQINANDDFLAAHGMKKGELVRLKNLKSILKDADDVLKTSGGAAANVAVGIAQHGGTAALQGTIGNDKAGIFLAKRLWDLGVTFVPVTISAPGDATTRIAVVTTPDAERSFAVTGNAAAAMTPADLRPETFEKASITYIDSYIWSTPTGKATAKQAAALAKAAGSLVAIATNGLEGVIIPNREEYAAYVRQYADALQGDRNEIAGIFGDFATARRELHARGIKAGITSGANDVLVIEDGRETELPVRKGLTVVDTSGAGDQFAAGMLKGLADGKSAVESALQGIDWSAAVIQHRGAEPQRPKGMKPRK